MEFLKEFYNITTPDQFFSWCENSIKKIDFDSEEMTPDKEEYFMVFMAGRKFLLKQDISGYCPDHVTKITEDTLPLLKFGISQKKRKEKMIKGDDSLCAAMVKFTSADMLPDGKGSFVPNGKRRCKKKHLDSKKYCYLHRKIEQSS